MRKALKHLLWLTAIISFVSSYSVGTKATPLAQNSSRYVEVCRGLAYLPPGTEYVTCRGRVMKVIAIVPLAQLEQNAQTEGDCFCPDCCGGGCTVIVSCQAEPEAAPGDESRTRKTGANAGGLCVAYLACGD